MTISPKGEVRCKHKTLSSQLRVSTFSPESQNTQALTKLRSDNDHTASLAHHPCIQCAEENKGENKSVTRQATSSLFFGVIWLISNEIKGQHWPFHVGISFFFFFHLQRTKRALCCFHFAINLVVSWAGSRRVFSPHECAYEEGSLQAIRLVFGPPVGHVGGCE